jgi:hypothetical protein
MVSGDSQGSLFFLSHGGSFEAWRFVYLPHWNTLDPQNREECAMKNKIGQIALLTTKVNRQHLQFLLAVAALAMLVLGIGAPSDGGLNPH